MKPILFSTPMVQAILNGRKTQTRRIVKIPDLIKYPERFVYMGDSRKLDIPRKAIPYDNRMYHLWTLDNDNSRSWVTDSYPIKEVLWVKEMHYRYGHWTKNGTSKTGKQKWLFVPDKQFTEVRYFDNPPEKIEKISFRGTGWYKRNSLFMPREACRLFLEVTNIRVERLQDISEQDAIAEGVKNPCYWDNNIIYEMPKGVVNLDVYPLSYALGYRSLWQSINGPGSWEKNQWVWVIEFRRINNPQ